MLTGPAALQNGASCLIMREVRLKRAAALRQRADDLRIESAKRPYLAATLSDVIEELERKAEQLEGDKPARPSASENGPSK